MSEFFTSKNTNFQDLHCGGEPARVLTGGAPNVAGTTMEEKRVEFMENHDHIRKGF